MSPLLFDEVTLIGSGKVGLGCSGILSGKGGGGEVVVKVGEEVAEWAVVLGDQCDFNIAFLDGVVEMKESCSRNFVERCCHLVGDCSLAMEDIVGEAETVVGGRNG